MARSYGAPAPRLRTQGAYYTSPGRSPDLCPQVGGPGRPLALWPIWGARGPFDRPCELAWAETGPGSGPSCCPSTRRDWARRGRARRLGLGREGEVNRGRAEGVAEFRRVTHAPDPLEALLLVEGTLLGLVALTAAESGQPWAMPSPGRAAPSALRRGGATAIRRLRPSGKTSIDSDPNCGVQWRSDGRREMVALVRFPVFGRRAG